MPVMKKTRCDAAQMDREGAAMLNGSLDGGAEARPSQNEITRVSRTTIIVAAEGPKRTVAAKTKVSETDKLAATPGTFTVKEPLSRVNTASMDHCQGIGDWISERKACRTANAPAAMTQLT